MYFRRGLFAATAICILAIFLWLDGLSPAPPALPGESLRLYTEQKGCALRDTLLRAIQKAEKSIVLMIYALREERIIDALNERARQGVSVSVICDAQASKGVWSLFTPQVRCYMRKNEKLMHLKILIIDEEQCWIGTANFSPDSFFVDANLLTCVADRSFAYYLQQKAEQMTHNSFYEKALNPQLFHLGQQRVTFHFLPDDPHAVDTICHLLQNAKHSVDIAIYTFTHQELASTLIHLSKRHVQVRLLVDKGAKAGAGAQIATRLTPYVYLKENSHPGLLHTKCALIDGKTLILGSANWTRTAFEQNEDCFMVIDQITPEQAKVWNVFWNQYWNNNEKSFENSADRLRENGPPGGMDSQTTRTYPCGSHQPLASGNPALLSRTPEHVRYLHRLQPARSG